ncbi:chromate transporter [uncultured Rikenella sp.]|uniref:chromate transporter n=1 Tax=uncultured Rikenella sp. TaxID=368003 RepID=UPI002621278D|nr:chromate transporter [uncultured Rikenella sp.]
MFRHLLTMFVSFFKIGCFTFGGGYAMIPIIQKEVIDKRRWVGKEEFINLLAVAQSAPGPMAVNVSILVGYKISRTRGAMAAFLGTVLPSFIILLVVAIFFSRIYKDPVVNSIFKGMRPAVVALILQPVFSFAKGLKYWEYGVFIAIAAAIWLKLSPVWFIAGGIAAGVGWTFWKSKRLTRQ